jgi:transposase-like protein
LQKLVGPEVSISSTQISRCTALLDAGLHAWRIRPLDETPYVILDARYERVREAGRVVVCAVLVAIDVTASGHRRVLGVSVALSEAEAHRVRMRTTNGLERLNKELKRRTRVATLFPNSASCLRLVSALLAEQDEEWTTAKIYLSIKP